MSSNLRRFVVFAIGILCLIWLLLYFDTRTNLRHIPNARWALERRSSPPPLTNAMSAPTPKTTSAVKTIFCVTDLYGHRATWERAFPVWSTYMPVRCEGGFRCRWILSSEDADAIIFDARDFAIERKTLPHEKKDQLRAQKWLQLTRKPHQRWVFFSWLSIVDAIIPRRNAFWKQRFNWTATYMRHSDIWTPYYRGIKRRTAPSPTPLYTAAEKRKFAFAVISNCQPKGRMRLIDALRRFVPVDVFGRCGRKLAPSADAIRQLSRRYRFYLALENSRCKDYISEKFWDNGLMGHAVPVVYGGRSRRDYDAVAPPNSFVFARDFPSVKALAAALRRIASNEREYAGYMAWKRRWQVDQHNMADSVMCGLCRRLHIDTRPASVNLNAFWDVKKHCREDTPMPDT